MAITNDSRVSPNHHHPIPSMQDRPFQHGTSQTHALLDHSAVQNPFEPNPTLVETPHSFSPRNLHHTQMSSQPAWLNTTPGVEDLESAMGGLSLSNPYRRNSAASVDLYSGSNDIWSSSPWEEHYEYEKQPLLHNRRIQAAAAGAASYASAGMRMRGSYGVPNGNRASPLGNGGGDNYNRIMMERSRSSLSGGQSPVWSQQRSTFNSLERVRGRVASVARDQCGCRFLQFLIDEGTPEEVETILSEVKDHSHELMTHHFGNYLIERIFEASTLNDEQIDRILYSIILNEHQLKHVCFNDHGTRVAQKMLQNLRTPVQVAAAVCALRSITVPLMKNVNGGYVIQQCVRLFSPTCKKIILDEVARSCVDVSTDRSGCSVIQKCLAHAEGEAIRLLVEEVILNAAILAEDPYGNYVVQYLVKRKMTMPPVNTMIVSRLRGKYIQLSMNRHASHVVEDLLKFSEGIDAAIIVLEIMDSPEFLTVLQDPFGNYVGQRALECSKGYVHKRLVNSILSNFGNLHSHPYGKRVLAFLKARKIRV